jgi:F0F1-type ATP synthase membrane subunit a
MIPDIFSSFDPNSFNYFIPLGPLFISINFIFITYVLTSISGLTNRKLAISAPILETIFTQLQRTTATNLKGVRAVVTSLFACIIAINLLGLVPYRFSTSSHLIFTLSFGLPL